MSAIDELADIPNGPPIPANAQGGRQRFDLAFVRSAVGGCAYGYRKFIPTVPRLKPEESQRERDAGKIGGDNYEVAAKETVSYPASEAERQQRQHFNGKRILLYLCASILRPEED